MTELERPPQPYPFEPEENHLIPDPLSLHGTIEETFIFPPPDEPSIPSIPSIPDITTESDQEENTEINSLFIYDCGTVIAFTGTDRLAKQAAFDKFVELNLLRVRATAQKFCKRYYILSDTDDIVSESLFNFWNAINRGVFTGERIQPYLTTIIHNLCVDNIRKRTNTRALETVSLEETVEWSIIPASSPIWIDPNPDPADICIRNEELKGVQKALTHLNENQRTVFLLTHLKGLKQREIAKLLKMPEGSVKTNIKQAKKNMQLFLLTDPNEMAS